MASRNGGHSSDADHSLHLQVRDMLCAFVKVNIDDDLYYQEDADNTPSELVFDEFEEFVARLFLSAVWQRTKHQEQTRYSRTKHVTKLSRMRPDVSRNSISVGVFRACFDAHTIVPPSLEATSSDVPAGADGEPARSGRRWRLR